MVGTNPTNIQRNRSVPLPSPKPQYEPQIGSSYTLFLRLLEDFKGVFLAAGSGICIFSRRAAVLLHWAFFGGELWNPGVAL